MLGTLVDISASAECAPQALNAAVDAAFGAIERVHQLMSFQDPASEVSMLNQQACHSAQKVHPQTHAVLSAALAMSRLSDGAFDISIAPQLQAWGYLPLDSALVAQQASWRDIELLGDLSVRFHQPMRIDLGGIAKGYAVDCAIDALRNAGVEAALVNCGGDLRAMGAAPQCVQLRHPQAPCVMAQQLLLQEQALATSANSFTRRHHAIFGETSALLDPHSRQPWLESASISVSAADCMSADALTKVVLFATPDVSERVLAAYAAQAYVLSPSEAVA